MATVLAGMWERRGGRLRDATHLGGNNRALPRPPIAGIVADPAGRGYWLLDAEAFRSGWTTQAPATPAVSSTWPPAKSARARRRQLLQPYGPCEEWCSLLPPGCGKRQASASLAMASPATFIDGRRATTRVMSARTAGRPATSCSTAPARKTSGPLRTGRGGAGLARWGDRHSRRRCRPRPWPVGRLSWCERPFPASQSYFANGLPIYAFASLERSGAAGWCPVAPAGT